MNEANREALEQIAHFLDNSIQYRHDEEGYSPATEYDYELGRIVGELRIMIATREIQNNPHAPTFPKEIYLNVGDGDEHEVGPFSELSEISWCWESMSRYDVRYIRADLA